jgi:hypothetical protein
MCGCGTWQRESRNGSRPGNLDTSWICTEPPRWEGIFAELARRAALDMSEQPDAFERHRRLSLKAPPQYRATKLRPIARSSKDGSALEIHLRADASAIHACVDG